MRTGKKRHRMILNIFHLCSLLRYLCLTISSASGEAALCQAPERGFTDWTALFEKCFNIIKCSESEGSAILFFVSVSQGSLLSNESEDFLSIFETENVPLSSDYQINAIIINSTKICSTKKVSKQIKMVWIWCWCCLLMRRRIKHKLHNFSLPIKS